MNGERRTGPTGPVRAAVVFVKRIARRIAHQIAYFYVIVLDRLDVVDGGRFLEAGGRPFAELTLDFVDVVVFFVRVQLVDLVEVGVGERLVDYQKILICVRLGHAAMRRKWAALEAVFHFGQKVVPRRRIVRKRLFHLASSVCCLGVEAIESGRRFAIQNESSPRGTNNGQPARLISICLFREREEKKSKQKNMFEED
ncbi:hypothetical protein BpHYR1_035217 [Brachionus plicatilis]|uniref:Uncharacterized protein n=1 Tax=Brachionus plicatilis TaxID=10195 RepID=A0A3M7T955_BRAPC|nr:hypothetical protein BpHYR1_035217 [Brachionus plicatilis]